MTHPRYQDAERCKERDEVEEDEVANDGNLRMHEANSHVGEEDWKGEDSRYRIKSHP